MTQAVSGALLLLALPVVSGVLLRWWALAAWPLVYLGFYVWFRWIHESTNESWDIGLLLSLVVSETFALAAVLVRRMFG